MKPRRRWSGLVAVSLGLALAPLTVQASPELAGVLIGSEQVQVVLHDPAKGETSPWLGIGQEFEDYTLTSYDRGLDQLILSRGPEKLVLALKAAKATHTFPVAIKGTIVRGEGEHAIYEDISLPFNQTTSVALPNGGRLEITLSWEAKQDDPKGFYKTQFAIKGSDASAVLLMSPSARETISAKGGLTIFSHSSNFTIRVGDLKLSLGGD